MARIFRERSFIKKKAIRKYGKENFEKKIIDIAYSREDLNNKEKYWIAFYDATKSSLFYNIAKGGTGGNTKYGYTPDEYAASERIRKRAISLNIAYGENAGSAKLTNENVLDIIARLKRGEFQVDVARRYNVSVSTINDIADHRTWKSLTDGIDFPVNTRKVVGERAAKVCSKPVTVYNKDFSYIGEYVSAREAEKQLNVSYRLISQVCHGDKKSAHGYIFRFVNN